MRELPLVVVGESLTEDAERWLAGRCRIRHAPPDAGDLAPALAGAGGLVVRTVHRVDAALLDHAPALRVVGRGGVGLDNIDVAECRRRGIDVVYTPRASTQAVVEYVFALITETLRPRRRVRQAVDRPTWAGWRAATVGRRQLNELTFGILGLGRIGTGVARVARAFGATVLFSDLREIPAPDRAEAVPVTTEALFRRSDLLSIHVDGRPSNRGIVGADLLGRLPEGAIVINTSRGFVVDKLALASFLRGRPDAQVHLDVHDPEPIEAGDPLLGLSNAHLYPHLASRTRASLAAMSWVVRDVAAVLAGERPEFPAP